MSNVENRVVELEMRNSSLEKGANKSIKTLDKLDKALDFKNGKRSFEDVEKAAEKCNFEPLLKAADTVQDRFSTLGIVGVRALERITDKAVDAGIALAKSLTIDQIASGYSKYEQKTASVQTLMNSTGKSLEEVNGYLARLMWFSDETSYGFTDMTSALATMTSSGGDIDKLIPMIEGVANAVAFAGKGASEFQRVMYNLNQSYSGGYLTLMDWKSVEQSGAASAQLKQVIIDTAVSLEKIKEGKVTVDNFNNKLASKFVDRDVMEQAFGYFDEMTQKAYEMIGTLDEQGNEISTASRAYEILAEQYDGVSIRAAKAAQEAKTFGEAIDATKDAVSSSWMRIFESIFGNYEQQKELWTGLANSLWDIFAGPLDSIAGLLDEALQTDTPTVLTEQLTSAGVSIDEFRKKLIETGKTAGKEFDEIEVSSASIADLLKFDWVDNDILTKTVESIGNVNDGFTDLVATEVNARELRKDLWSGKYGWGYKTMTKNLKEAGYQIESVQEVYTLASKDADAVITKLGASAENTADQYNTVLEIAKDFSNEYYDINSGRTIGLAAIVNILSALGDRLEFAKQAWGDVFPSASAETIKDAIIRFYEWSETLAVGAEEGDSIYATFHRVFEIISKIGTIGKSAFGVMASILELIGRFGGYVGGLEPVKSFLETLKDTLGSRIDAGENWLVTAADSLNKFADRLDAIDENDFASFVDKIMKPFETLKSFFAPMVTFLKDLGGQLKSVLANLFTHSDDRGNGIGLQAILGAGGIAGVIAIVKKIKDALSNGGITSIGAQVTETLSSVKESIESFTDKMNSDGLRNIAISLALLAGSLLLLSSIDTERLVTGLFGLAAIAGVLYITIGKLSKLDIGKNSGGSGIGGFIKNLTGNIAESAQFMMLASSIQKIAIALLIMAASVKLLSTIDVGGALVALATLFAVTKIIESFMKSISNMKMVSVSGLISIAVSMILFASAIRILGAMDLGSCIQGVLALGVIMLELKYFLSALSDVKSGTVLATAASMVIMAAGLVVMSAAIAIMGAIPFKNAVKGLAIIAALLVGFTMFAKSISTVKVGSLMAAAVSILLVSVALVPLSAALILIGAISDKVGSVAALLVTIVGIATVLALLGNFGGGALNLIAASAAILVVSAAIMVLSAALVAISAIGNPIATILTLLGTLAVVFVVLGVAALVLTPVMPAMLALSGILALVGVACLAAGVGITLLSTGLVAFAGAIIANVDMIIVAFTMIVTGVGTVLLAIGGVIVSVLTQLIPSLAEAGLQMILALLTSFDSHVGDIGAIAFSIIIKLVGVLASGVDLLVQAAINLAIALVNGLANGIRDNAEPIMAAVRNILSSIIELVLTVLGDLLGMIPGIGPKIEEALSGAKDTVRNFLAPETTGTGEELSDTLTGAVASAGETASEEATTQGENVGNAFVGSIGETISGGLSENNPLASMFGGGMELSGDNLLSGFDMSSLGASGGASYMDSFAGGMTSNAESATTAGTEVGTQVTQAVNETIESNSEGTANSIFTMLSNAAGMVDMDSIGNILSGNFMNSLGESFLSESGVDSETLSGNFLPLIQKMVDNTDLSGTGENMGDVITEAFCDSLESTSNQLEVSDSAKSLGNEANEGAQQVDTTASGSYWGEGLNNGMWSWADRIWKTAYNIGKKAVDGVKTATEEGSPCETTIRSGKFFGEGLVIGIDMLGARVQAAGYTMGMRAAMAVEDGIQNGNADGIVPVLDMSDVYSTLSDFDDTYRPVIKPTLDMSGMDPSFMNMQAVVSHKSTGTSSVDAGTSRTVSPTSFNFTQNNYSPKALSRVAIYRQTKNQFSAVKDMIKK